MTLSHARDETTSGFAVLDDKGRLPVAKALRDALGLKPGSSVAYVLIDGLLLIIPQDEQLARMTARAAATLAKAGLTTQDLLDDIPVARADVVRELYGDAFMEEWPTRRRRTLLDEDDCGILRPGGSGCGGCGRLVRSAPVEECGPGHLFSTLLCRL